MSLESEYLEAFEVHSPDGIRAALARGASATSLVKGKTPLDSLVEGYHRSPRLADCVRVLLDAGATFAHPLLETLFLDDEIALGRLIDDNAPAVLATRLSVPSAFTSCDGITPLHLCAEFNLVRCGRLLIDAGAEVDAAASIDSHGFGGQTPIFHTVNSPSNYCRPMMEILAEAGARLDVQLKGLTWGSGAAWETLILDVTPISYAQCGLYSQFHRRETDVYANLAYLFEKRYRQGLPMRNIPNSYLASG